MDREPRRKKERLEAAGVGAASVAVGEALEDVREVAETEEDEAQESDLRGTRMSFTQLLAERKMVGAASVKRILCIFEG